MFDALLTPLACAILLSGLDDLFVAIAALFATAPPAPAAAAEKRIAIFVPCWREDPVIAAMLEHNLAAIHYQRYDFFIGAYPNDEPTLEAIRAVSARFPRVHLALCPHDGPTSKPDCLNWIYQRMQVYEDVYSVSFEIVVIHDAEDLIHPQSLSTINRYSVQYGMIQIPVLPLRTPFLNLTHGAYIDDFAEWQIKDMPARAKLGSFVPSNGVGTGYTRAFLERLDAPIFDPGSLTEDYEIGLRLHRLGCPQIFVALDGGRAPVATREYFPRDVRGAVRQRSRWISGIALQTWERHGWNGPLAHVYWFWRDRKGLLGNPLSLLANLVFLYGLLRPPPIARPGLLSATLALLILQMGIRCGCVARLYGPVFALGVPLRIVWANAINTAATVRAVHGYFRARLRHESLGWLKTDHAYPTRGALAGHKRRLGEILADAAWISERELDHALSSQPPGVRIGEHLMRLGKITEDDLYAALSLQQSLPLEELDPLEISPGIARSLPSEVVRAWKVLPYRIVSGSMFLATPELPSDELTRTLRGFTRLTLRFHLVTPRNFTQLTKQFL
ncbi:MAG: glycosyl transferase family protein [Acidobacteriota bacterium]|nr:glycosyl transferase family protein [Acidobacteriota bacterium]